MSAIDLTEAQRTAIEEATRWERDALTELGRAQLRCRDRERELAQAQGDHAAKEGEARRAMAQTEMVLRAISAQLQLPPGYWTYDAVAGKLVRKDDHA